VTIEAFRNEIRHWDDQKLRVYLTVNLRALGSVDLNELCDHLDAVDQEWERRRCQPDGWQQDGF